MARDNGLRGYWAFDLTLPLARWEFTPGVDDVASECALDGRVWDVTIDNDGTDRLGVDLTALEKRIRESL